MHPPKRAAAPSGVLGSAAEPLSAFTCELQLLHDIDPVQGERWMQAAASRSKRGREPRRKGRCRPGAGIRARAPSKARPWGARRNCARFLAATQILLGHRDL
jgi:hypothetical protein